MATERIPVDRLIPLGLEVNAVPEMLSDGSEVWNVVVRDILDQQRVAIPAVTARDAVLMAEAISVAMKLHGV